MAQNDTLTLNSTKVMTSKRTGGIDALVSDLLGLSSRHGVSLGTMVITGKTIKPKRRLVAKVTRKVKPSMPTDLFDHEQHEQHLESKEGHEIECDFDFGDTEPKVTKWYLDHWVRHSDGETYSLSAKFAKQYPSDSTKYYDTQAEAEAAMADEYHQPKISRGSKYWFVLKSVTL